MKKRGRKKNGANKKLSIRQQRYKAYRLAGMAIAPAAIKSGYSPSYAKSNRVDRWAGVSFIDQLEIAGITDRQLAIKAAEGLEATTITVGRDGEIIERPDYAVRHKYLQTLLSMIGHLRRSDDGVAKTLSEAVLALVRTNQQQLRAEDVSTTIDITASSGDNRPVSNNSGELEVVR